MARNAPHMHLTPLNGGLSMCVLVCAVRKYKGRPQKHKYSCILLSTYEQNVSSDGIKKKIHKKANLKPH